MNKRLADAPAGGTVDLIDGILDRAIAARASDVHFEPTDREVRVRFRVDGRLHDIEALPAALLPNLVTRLKVMAGLLSYRIDIPQEGGLTLDRGVPMDVRISTFPTIRGERVAVRLLPRAAEVRGLDDLGLSEPSVRSLVSASAAEQGLILVTGPAGSGKTTTLYAVLRHLRTAMHGASLMTVEDPVELRLDGVAQIQVTPHGELTYARALRSLLRQDPQVILIGEIRDAETARIATEAALTGHLILSTMHSGRSIDAIVRMLEMGIPAYQLTSTLRVVTCQRLLRTLCPSCRGAAQDRPADQSCRDCLNLGFRGRTACAEVVRMTDELRTAILGHADTRRLAEAVRNQTGYVSLAADAERHLHAGRTPPEEIDALTATLRGCSPPNPEG